MALGITRLSLDEEIKKLAPTGGSGLPSGTAGGALSGTYPNPGLAAGVATGSVLGSDVITTSSAAAGDLSGTFAALTIKAGSVTSTKLADGAATGTKLGSDVAKLVGGLVPPANLGSGTADASHVLSGAGTWITPPGGAPSGAAGGALSGTYPNPTLATGVATGSVLGSDVVVTSQANVANGYVKPNGSNLISLGQMGTGTPSSTTYLRGDGTWAAGTAGPLSGLSDATITTPATGQMLVFDGAKWINVLHKRRLRGYAAFKGDGTTDDSAVWNQAISDAGTKGWVEAPAGVTSRGKNITLASNVVIDLNDSIVKLAAGATSSDDVFRSTNFNTLTGTNGTGGVYLPKLMHGRIDGNSAGRHGIACYGVPRLDDLIIHGCGGSAIWAEWNSGASGLSALGLGDGDQTGKFSSITAYDCSLGTALPSTFNATLQGPTTPTWSGGVATYPFSTPHLRRVGDTIVVSGYSPAGWNGTFTVASVPSTTSLTVSMASNPGANTVVGSVTHQKSAMVAILGMDSPFVRDLDIYQTLSVVPGSVGLLLGNSGTAMQNVHVYQNFATGLDICNGNNTRVEGFYCGGHDQGILLRQNYVQMVNAFVSSGFNNSIGFDYQSVGGACQLQNIRVDTLPSGSICYRIWNTSTSWWLAQGVGDGGTNTSTLYTAPNGTGGVHGAIYNLGNGLNATPASLVNFT